jgi:hypothetical protein
MSQKPVESDKRTRVDRMLDHVKNNRVIAVLLVFGIGLAALASFTESVKKLVDVVPRIAKPHITGEWRSDPIDLYDSGPQVLVLHFKEVVGGQLTGSVKFLGADGKASSREHGILDGKLEGSRVSFSFDGGFKGRDSSGEYSVIVMESLTGEISKDQIRFVYRRDGSPTKQIILKRVAQAAGSNDGR